MTNYYALLDVPATAPPEEIKRAFRQQIALYHPDKVQHLGKEFQTMAAERAAALTEAYRVLSHDEHRAEYDRSLAAPAIPTTANGATAPPPAPVDEHEAAVPPRSTQFEEDRARRDAFVRRATMSRFQQALDAVAVDYQRGAAVGFDVACMPPGKLFGRNKNPRLLARFVPAVDAPAVAEAWSRAAQWTGSDDACVFLLGSSLAPAGELARVIAEQRRKHSQAKLTMIPVDARDWQAHMPVDAPPIAKLLLVRLRSGS